MARMRAVTLAAAAGLAAATMAGAQAYVYVTEEGAFDPNGSSSAPFDTIHAGLAEADARNGGPGVRYLALSTGTYSETMTIDEPTVLLNPQGGSARIGDMGSASTPFRVATFNTHLYGDVVPSFIVDVFVALGWAPGPLAWQDFLRGLLIAGKYNDGAFDVVALQEVWDPDRMGSIRDGVQPDWTMFGTLIDYHLLPGCVLYPGGCYPLALNSGLMTMGNVNIVDAAQVFFASETGTIEEFASKGYLRTVVRKDGFTVLVYNVHAQAGDESEGDVLSTRYEQMEQLRNDVVHYRNLYPSAPTIILGDLNIRGSGSVFAEYTTTLRTLFDTELLPFVDAARSDRANRALNAVTSDDDNRLGQYFGGDPGDKRLDYVLYAPSQDGTVRLVHEQTQTVRQRSDTPLSGDGLSTIELSDHWAVHTDFTLVRG